MIESVGKIETVEESFSFVKKGGRIVIFGFCTEGEEAKFIPFDFISKELTLLSSWVNPYTFPRALKILASGKIDLKLKIHVDSYSARAEEKIKAAGGEIVSIEPAEEKEKAEN